MVAAAMSLELHESGSHVVRQVKMIWPPAAMA
jgi:hypothetical protein